MTIKLIDISKAYGSNLVLDSFNLNIQEGSSTCIMGPSGGGKTTLLRIMMGLELADSGKIEGFQQLRRSAVFQEDRLCENLSAASNIQLVCRKRLEKNAIDKAIHAVGLPFDCAKQPVRNMSGGQRRRIAILRALMSEYDILFMDEPFKGLDTETKKQVMNYTVKQTQGKTVVLVTHDKVECEAIGGSVIVIDPVEKNDSATINI